MPFLDEKYLFSTGNTVAQEIYAKIRTLPIIDVHTHANIKEIRENQCYTDIWQVEGATDHYIWELMRKRGIEEYYITGRATNKEKWMVLASVFESFVGNPVYEWIHLDLKRRLGIIDQISSETAQTIWDQAESCLRSPNMRPQSILKEMGVEILCTTDDPMDTLEDHQYLSEKLPTPKIYPTWRPDKVMDISHPDYLSYLHQLADRFQSSITNFADLLEILRKSHVFFKQNHCHASDHGILVPYGHRVSEQHAAAIFDLKLNHSPLSLQDTSDFQAFLLHFFGELNTKEGWITQIHIGAVRNYRDILFSTLGSDSGGDISSQVIDIATHLREFLNHFDCQLKLVLYCLDPGHLPTLATISRAFGDRIALGSAWWYNDSPYGMKNQLECIGSIDLLCNFLGMVTDSRKLISYGSRTEMFRRILADYLGEMVRKGQIPYVLAEQTAIYLCYARPKTFFGF